MFKNLNNLLNRGQKTEDKKTSEVTKVETIENKSNEIPLNEMENFESKVDTNEIKNESNILETNNIQNNLIIEDKKKDVKDDLEKTLIVEEKFTSEFINAQDLLKKATEEKNLDTLFDFCQQISELYEKFSIHDIESDEYNNLNDELVKLYAVLADYFLEKAEPKEEKILEQNDNNKNEDFNDSVEIKNEEKKQAKLDVKNLIICVQFLINSGEEKEARRLCNFLQTKYLSEKVEKSEDLITLFTSMRDLYLKKTNNTTITEVKESYILYAHSFNDIYLKCAGLSGSDAIKEYLKVYASFAKFPEIVKNQKAFLLKITNVWLSLSSNEQMQSQPLPADCIDAAIADIKIKQEKQKTNNSDTTDYNAQLKALYFEGIHWFESSKNTLGSDINTIKRNERKVSEYFLEISIFRKNNKNDKTDYSDVIAQAKNLIESSLQNGLMQLNKNLDNALFESVIIANCYELCGQSLDLKLKQEIAKFRRELTSVFLNKAKNGNDVKESQKFLQSAITACGSDDDGKRNVQYDWIILEFEKDKTIERLTAIINYYKNLVKDCNVVSSNESELAKNKREKLKDKLPELKKKILKYLIEKSKKFDFTNFKLEDERKLFNLAITICETQNEANEYIDERALLFQNTKSSEKNKYTREGIDAFIGYYELLFLLDYKEDNQLKESISDKENALFEKLLVIFASDFSKDLKEHMGNFLNDTKLSEKIAPLNIWARLLSSVDKKNRYYTLGNYDGLVAGDDIKIIKFIIDFLVEKTQNNDIKLKALEFRRRLLEGLKYKKGFQITYLGNSFAFPTLYPSNSFEELINPTDDIILAQIYTAFSQKNYFLALEMYQKINFPEKKIYAENKSLTTNMQSWDPGDLIKECQKEVDDILKNFAKNPKNIWEEDRKKLRDYLSLLEGCNLTLISKPVANSIYSKNDFESLKNADYKNYTLIEGTDFYVHNKLVFLDKEKIKKAVSSRKGVKFTDIYEFSDFIKKSGGKISNEEEEISLFIKEQNLTNEKNPLIVKNGKNIFIKYPGEAEIIRLNSSDFANITFPEKDKTIIKSNGNRKINEAVVLNKPTSFRPDTSFPDDFKKRLQQISDAFGPERASSDAGLRAALVLATPEEKLSIYDVQLSESNEADAIQAIKGLAELTQFLTLDENKNEALTKKVKECLEKHIKSNCKTAFSSRQFGEIEKKAVNLYIQFALSFPSEKKDYKELSEQLTLIENIVYKNGKELTDNVSVGLYIYFLNQLIAKLPENDALRNIAIKQKKNLLESAGKILKSQGKSLKSNNEQMKLEVVYLIAPELPKEDY